MYIALLVLGGLSGFFGIYVFTMAQSAIHEQLGMLAFIFTAVCWAAFDIGLAVRGVRRQIRESGAKNAPTAGARPEDSAQSAG